jgi:hypothetical protein
MKDPLYKICFHWFFLMGLTCFSSKAAVCQTIDSIAFHLYTDSLKKGVHNYINVDGLQSGGRWLPLTDKDLRFKSNAGNFEGNNLVIDRNFTGEKVIVTATYIRNTKLSVTTTIYIKVLADEGTIVINADTVPAASTQKKSGKKKKGNP